MPDSGRGLPASVEGSRMSPRHGARSYTGSRALPSTRPALDPIVIEVKSGEMTAPDCERDWSESGRFQSPLVLSARRQARVEGHGAAQTRSPAPGPSTQAFGLRSGRGEFWMKGKFWASC